MWKAFVDDLDKEILTITETHIKGSNERGQQRPVSGSWF
jgi:hypothetical protein